MKHNIYYMKLKTEAENVSKRNQPDKKAENKGHQWGWLFNTAKISRTRGRTYM